MKTMRFFKVSFKGPIDFTGARVLIRDLRFNRSKTIAYDYTMNYSIDMAIKFLESKGIEVACIGENINSMLIGTENLDIQI